MKNVGMANVITHLHRNPGIDAETHPELFEYCIDRKERVNAHFALEGMQIVYDLHLGVVSTVCLDDVQIAAHCEVEKTEMFRPVYTPRSEDYYSSVLIIILRLRYEASLTNPATAWIDEADLIAEFESYIAPADRVNTAKTRDKVTRKLDGLCRSHLAERRTLMGNAQYSATKWLVLRLTSTVIEEMSQKMFSFVRNARSAAGEEVEDFEVDLEVAEAVDLD